MTTLEIALESFNRYLTNEKASERTTESYCGAIHRLLGSYPAWATPDSEAFLVRWRNSVQRRYAEGEVSDSYIRVAVAALRRFYQYCKDTGLVAENYAKDLRSITPDSRLPRPMAVPDVAKLIAVIPEDDLQSRAMIELMLNGLRNVEICRMNVGWVSVVPNEGTLCVRVLGKGNKEGDVMLSPSAATALTNHLLVRLASPHADEFITEDPLIGVADCLWRYSMAKNDPMFLVKGHRPTRQNINAMFRYYRDKAGLPREYGPHNLRHTCGTELVEGGVDIRVVQEILRHQNIAQTTQYTKIRRGPKAAAMRKLPTFA